MAPRVFGQFFSTDSAKAIKAQKYGYLNAINYMAPADLAGLGNLCPHASAGCKALCLGWFSGQAGMVKGNRKRGTNSVRKSRIAKVQMFMRDRQAFMGEMVRGIEAAERKAKREGLRLCVRLNGATDIGWEGVRLTKGRNVFETFQHVQFVDYTKSKRRMLAWCEGKLPGNYHLTFSRSETNEADCLDVLAAGGTVAAVFAGQLPQTWHGYRVVNGDETDLRHLDDRSVVVGLSPKGPRAKRDRSGFVIQG
jgi:hypothetical protein